MSKTVKLDNNKKAISDILDNCANDNFTGKTEFSITWLDGGITDGYLSIKKKVLPHTNNEG